MTMTIRPHLCLPAYYLLKSLQTLLKNVCSVDLSGAKTFIISVERSNCNFSSPLIPTVIAVAWVPWSPYCPVQSVLHALGLARGAPGGMLFALPSTGGPFSLQWRGMSSRRLTGPSPPGSWSIASTGRGPACLGRLNLMSRQSCSTELGPRRQ